MHGFDTNTGNIRKGACDASNPGCVYNSGDYTIVIVVYYISSRNERDFIYSMN